MPPLTPEGRKARASKGAGTRWHKPELVQAAEEVILRERVDRTIREMVATWPPLTDAQKDDLAVLFRNGGRAAT